MAVLDGTDPQAAEREAAWPEVASDLQAPPPPLSILSVFL